VKDDLSDRKPRRRRGKIWIALFGAIAALSAGAALIPATAAALPNDGGECTETGDGCEVIEVTGEYNPLYDHRSDFTPPERGTPGSAGLVPTKGGSPAKNRRRNRGRQARLSNAGISRKR
jgi:hypothetical protein